MVPMGVVRFDVRRVTEALDQRRLGRPLHSKKRRPAPAVVLRRRKTFPLLDDARGSAASCRLGFHAI